MLLAIRIVSAYDLQVGTNHLNLAFENPNTPVILQDFIFNDIQRCYSAYGTNVGVVTYSSGVSSLEAKHVAEGPYCADDSRRARLPRTVETRTNGTFAVEIPVWLISKYAEAYVFKTNNLAKVQAADNFVDFLGSADFPNISSNAVKNYILYDLTNDNEYAEMAAEIIASGMSNIHYRPSILGFSYMDDYGPAGTNLFVRIPVKGKYSASSNYYVFPAIWHDGRWKICLWSDWE
jgi:hypothetical protein